MYGKSVYKFTKAQAPYATTPERAHSKQEAKDAGAWLLLASRGGSSRQPPVKVDRVSALWVLAVAWEFSTQFSHGNRQRTTRAYLPTAATHSFEPPALGATFSYCAAYRKKFIAVPEKLSLFWVIVSRLYRLFTRNEDWPWLLCICVPATALLKVIVKAVVI